MRNRRNRRRGAAAVEFAAVAPVFFLMIFGMLETGRMLMVQQVLVNASREGARAAVLDGATASSVSTVVTNYLNAASVPGGTCTITPTDPSTAAYGSSVTVTVRVSFSQVSWLPTPLFLGDMTLQASTMMRRETVP